MSDQPARLIPRRFTVGVVALLVVVLLLTAVSWAVDGFVAQSIRGVNVAVALLLVAALSALVRPRRRREPEVRPDGTRVFLAPALTTWPLLGAWGVVLVVAGMWAYVALTDFSALESPGWALITIGGAIGSLPDLVRLLTGRLHRWRLEIGPDGVTYRGYRTDQTWPWATVHGARLQARPAGVAIDVKGPGDDPLVPITAFAVSPEQLVEEIRQGKAAARR